MSQYSSQQIADWFIARNRAELCSDDNVEPITKIKVNMLMYFAQGIYLALYDERLFNDKFYSCRHGFVAGKIYNKYKGQELPEFKNNIPDKIAFKLAKNYDQILSDTRATEVLNTVWYEFEDYTENELVTISHDKDEPWAKVYKKGKCLIPINDDDIKSYFREFVVECHG